jgi:hypothetical protein
MQSGTRISAAISKSEGFAYRKNSQLYSKYDSLVKGYKLEELFENRMTQYKIKNHELKVRNKSKINKKLWSVF